jgi:hypothetical protein
MYRVRGRTGKASPKLTRKHSMTEDTTSGSPDMTRVRVDQ